MAAHRASRIKLKRAYEPAANADGCRVLVDGLWPRGISKAALRLDAWLKEIAPSPSLRRWFGHDPVKWETFKTRYFRELDQNPAPVAALRARSRTGTLTLVFAAADAVHNNAAALKEYLTRPRRRAAR